jgi:hypothetical protein
LLLSLVTTRDRAVSVAGDLLEASEAQGAAQFWLLVVRTTVRQAWREIAAAPFGMAGAAVRGWFVGLRISLVALVTLGLPVSIVLALLKFGFHVDPFGWTIPLLGEFLAGLLIPFQVGRWMARRYPGREVAGCFSLVTLELAIGICMTFIVWATIGSGGLARWGFSPSEIAALPWEGNLFHFLASAIFWSVLDLVPLLAGAAFARARMFQESPRTT